ncbi:hypothetical protein [Parasulfitobacter algicola]|uniref:Uncharacterized protein n=1 Tax=Parasulfitobacter algicola TaxID=2614809 RepID=A0ABX2IVC9_9RHOB|nr:hypothetical protein [Sulfitobacter algicola]NSX55961.1 hypothetical protein [Sulfitobacter algicola]
MRTLHKSLSTFLTLALLPAPANADVSAVTQAFVNVCPAALIRGVSPLDLGMGPQVEGTSRVLTKELIAAMPGVFWRNDATEVTMSLPLGGMSCVVIGEVGAPHFSLAEFDEWRARHPNMLQLIETQTLRQSASNAGVFLELCLMDPSDHREHRVIGEISKRQDGWSLNLAMHRDEACKYSS